MIRDARALDDQYVPRDLAHRDGQIDHLTTALDPVTRGESAENVCLFGPSGAGKTTLAKYTLGQLAAETFAFRWAYANCMTDNTRSALLHRLVDDARLAHDLRREGTHTRTFVDRIREFDGQVVAVLDEVDLLPDPRVLLALLDVPNCGVLTICTDENHLFADLDQRITSRLRSAATVTLDPYSQAELVDILAARVRHGLDEKRVTDAALEQIADCAAGDAREAIGVLRRAALEATETGRAITPALVEECAAAARRELRDRQVRTLGTHQRALYDLIQEAGSDGIRASALHEAYEERVQQPKTRRTRRRYLDSLERYELIRAEGSSRGTRYKPVSF